MGHGESDNRGPTDLVNQHREKTPRGTRSHAFLSHFGSALCMVRLRHWRNLEEVLVFICLFVSLGEDRIWGSERERETTGLDSACA